MSAPESSSPLQWLGNWVPIRSLGRRHRQRIGEHLLALTPSDRYLRFGHAIGDGQITRYAQTLDFERDELFGVFNRRLQVIAMAHLAIRGRAAPIGRTPPSSASRCWIATAVAASAAGCFSFAACTRATARCATC
jgi:hypothetical protein